MTIFHVMSFIILHSIKRLSFEIHKTFSDSKIHYQANIRNSVQPKILFPMNHIQ